MMKEISCFKRLWRLPTRRKFIYFSILSTLILILRYSSIWTLTTMQPPISFDLVPNTSFRIKSSSEARLFRELLAKQASPEKEIILIYVDLPFVSMALNFYESSLLRLGLRNFLFLTSNATACTLLNAAQRLSCCVYSTDAAAAKASDYGTADFTRKMNVRTYMILEALELGYTVLHTDTDIHFVKNPFERIRSECNDCDMAALYDTPDYNAGFIYVRPTRNSITVYSKMVKAVESGSRMNDQDQLTATILSMKSIFSSFSAVRLPEDQFLNGKTYFEEGVREFFGDNPCEECVVIHNNWIVSMEAKIYRFKEHLLWNSDYDGYYSDKNRRYLSYDNPATFSNKDDVLREELTALRSALTIGYILNRTVILPIFHYCQQIDTDPNMKREFCALNSFLDITQFDEYFGGMYREHVFLQHPRVPHIVKDSLSENIFYLDKESALRRKFNIEMTSASDAMFLVSSNSYNVSEDDIMSWFSGFTSSILRFGSLYRSFPIFRSPDRDFDKRLTLGLQLSNYRQYRKDVKYL